MGTTVKAVLPTLLPLLENKDEDTYRYALIAAMKIAEGDQLPKSAERGLKEWLRTPSLTFRQGNVDSSLLVRHLQRYGMSVLPEFVSACNSTNWQVALRGAHGLSLFGVKAQDHLPLLKRMQEKFAGNSSIQIPLQQYIRNLEGSVDAAELSGLESVSSLDPL
jgi:hypothetical protein